MSNTNKSNDDNNTLKTALFVAGGAAIVAGAAFAIKKTFFCQQTQSDKEGAVLVENSQVEGEKKTEQQTTQDEVKESKEGESPQVQQKKKKKKISQTRLVSDIRESMASITQTGAFGALESRILKRIKEMVRALDRYEPSTRLEASSWLIVYNTLSLLSAQSIEEAKARSVANADQIGHAWDLLDFDRRGLKSKEEEVRFLMAKIDLAQRLREIEVMTTLLDEVLLEVQKSGEISLIVVGFTTAATLGRWAEFKQLGELMERAGQSLMDFHLAAQQRHDIPDFKVLFEMMGEEMKSPEPDWSFNVIESCSLQFESVEGNSPESEQEILQSFDPAHGAQELHNVKGKQISRTGSVVQGQGVSQLPIVVVGPAVEGKLILEGFVDMDQPPIGSFHQREKYDLDLDTEKSNGDLQYYVGDYYIEQVQGGAEIGISNRVVMKFKMNLVLRTAEPPF